MNKNHFITVSLCVYNGAIFIEQTLESLNNQTCKDFSLLIVDDGSTDCTYEIGLELQETYPHIVKVVHQENGGHGSAVNTGLREATGLYFKVLDSDDWVKEEALLEVLATLRNLVELGSNLDMFICNYVYEKVGEERK